MQFLLVPFAVSSLFQVAEERKIVAVGEPLAVLDADRRDGVEVADLLGSIDRKANLVARVYLPAGSRLERQGSSARFCSADKGYRSAYEEYGVCAVDEDGDGRFELVRGGRFKDDEFKLKVPVPYKVEKVTVFVPSNNPRRIVYLGGTAGEMRFSYREFTTTGLARPAFTEDLTVPVTNFPVTLTLKGVRFTVFAQSALGLDVAIKP